MQDLINKDLHTTDLVAVYGTLREGHGNHEHLMQGAELLGTERVQGFQMYTTGGFPVTYRSEAQRDSVLIEVYKVSSGTQMRNLDALEGHPRWYRREVIETKFGPAWIYLMRSESYKQPDRKIQSGDWNNKENK